MSIMTHSEHLTSKTLSCFAFSPPWYLIRKEKGQCCKITKEKNIIYFKRLPKTVTLRKYAAFIIAMFHIALIIECRQMKA